MKPLLVGVIHLEPLPGSPLSDKSARDVARGAAEDAQALEDCGFDAIIVENFGDAPFFAREVPPITISAMTACALSVREACPSIRLGINVLRNDAIAALSIAVATSANFVRINVHTGARVTDQGVVEGRAAETMRVRRALLADAIEIWADVDVKHSAPLASRALDQETHDLVARGLVDAVLVTGEGTGRPVDEEKVSSVRRAARGTPVFVASGATLESLNRLSSVADGVIVGSALRAGGVAGGRIDRGRTEIFAEAFRAAFSSRT